MTVDNPVVWVAAMRAGAEYHEPRAQVDFTTCNRSTRTGVLVSLDVLTASKPDVKACPRCWPTDSSPGVGTAPAEGGADAAGLGQALAPAPAPALVPGAGATPSTLSPVLRSAIEAEIAQLTAAVEDLTDLVAQAGPAPLVGYVAAIRRQLVALDAIVLRLTPPAVLILDA